MTQLLAGLIGILGGVILLQLPALLRLLATSIVMTVEVVTRGKRKCPTLVQPNTVLIWPKEEA